MTRKKKISLIGTTFNEEGNIETFCRRADAVLSSLGADYELIIVDDGSRDATPGRLRELKPQIPALRIITLQRNFGQAAAIDAGFSLAAGEVVLVFDTDMQQDPGIIPALLEKYDEGCDVVSGHRTKRKHPAVYRFMAWVGFVLRKFLLNIPVRDTACSPNAYRGDILRDLNLQGEMHRFLVPMLVWRGYRVVEVAVPHHKRTAGRSKYSVFKSVRAFLDLIVIKFWMGFSVQPMHLFGGAGMVLGILGFMVGMAVIYIRSTDPNGLLGSTIPLFSVLLMLMAAQFLFFGILADVIIKVYYKDRKAYFIRDIL